MASLGQVTYDIKEALKDFSDDSQLDNRYIIYLLNIKRAKYLKQRLEKPGRNFDTRITQTLCLDTEIVSTNECGLELTCSKIVRTKQTVPDLLQLTNKDAIQRVSPADKLSVKFNLIDRERAPYYLSSNFKSKVKSFLHDDGHIYLISSEPILLDCLSLTGVFEDPTELQNYKNCCGCENEDAVCYDLYETEYPVQTDMLDIIRKDIIQELTTLLKVPQDKINNSNDDI